MLIAAIGLLFAAAEGPPPYPDSLNCAALTRAWSDLESEAGSEGAVQAREDAEFWAFALMDSARRAGMTPRKAESDYERAASDARDRFGRGDEAAPVKLKACQGMIPAREADEG